MNRIIKILLHPRIACNYCVRDTKMLLRKKRYHLRIKKGYDFHAERLRAALKYARAHTKEELFEIWKHEQGHAFVEAKKEQIRNIITNDKHYSAQVINSANKVLDNTFYVLYRDVENRKGDDNHYLWFRDYRTDYDYKLVFYSDSRKENRNLGTDYKRVWEIARMQYLLSPALAYIITQDEKYAKVVKDILLDFSCCNSIYIGPNWNPSMEVGIRAANIVLCLELIKDSELVDADFVQEMTGLLYDHQKVILENQENTGGKTSNHYLGGLLGLAAISTYLPFLKKSKKILDYVYESIIYEIDTQILNDGGDYEGSTSYHRLVGELFAYTIIACQHNGCIFSDHTVGRLYNMARFTINIISETGAAFQIGDNDSGRVFQILPENPNDHRYMVDLVTAVCKGYIHYGSGYQLISILQNRIYHTIPVEEKKNLWIASDFGIGRIQANDLEVIISAIDAQKNGMGGHTHNDFGSFNIRCKQYPIIIDPGTGYYTGDPQIRNTLRSIDYHSSLKINGIEPRKISDNLFGWKDYYGHVSLKQIDDKISVELKRNEYTLKRIFSSRLNEIIIQDNIIAENYKTATMSLVLDANTTPEVIDNNKAIIHGKFGTIKLSGTWSITVKDGIYSPNYDLVRNTKVLILYSCYIENELIIQF